MKDETDKRDTAMWDFWDILDESTAQRPRLVIEDDDYLGCLSLLLLCLGSLLMVSVVLYGIVHTLFQLILVGTGPVQVGALGMLLFLAGLLLTWLWTRVPEVQ